jgi:hypothetical protein
MVIKSNNFLLLSNPLAKGGANGNNSDYVGNKFCFLRKSAPYVFMTGRIIAESFICGGSKERR